MRYVLQYIQSDGTQMEQEFDSDDTIIDLSNKDIIQFDVSQLRSNGSITELHLGENKISRVDLTPLRSCKRLKTITLDDTTEGETILSDSTMEKISKEVVYDEITNFDSLSHLPSLNSIGYSLPYVKKRESKWKLIHLFQNALFVLGLGWMGFLDIGIKQSEQLLKKLTSSGYTDKIQSTLMTSLIDQIDRGGPTLDLDVESMKDYGELVMRIDDVVELRNEEMKDQYVPVLTFNLDKESRDLLESVGESVDSHYVDLRMLWLSSYGYEVLASMKLRTTCAMKVFSKVESTLSALGFDIKTLPELEVYSIIGWRNRSVLRKHGIESPEPAIVVPEQLSSEMIEYIWQLAEFRNEIQN